MELFVQSQQRSRLGQILIKKKLISNEQLAKAMTRQATTGERLGDILAEWNLVTNRHIESALRAQRNVRLVASFVTALITPVITACGGGGGGGGGETSKATQSAQVTTPSPTTAVAAVATPTETEPSTTPPLSSWVIKESVCCAAVTNQTSTVASPIDASPSIVTTSSTATSPTVVQPSSTTAPPSTLNVAALTTPTNLVAQAPAATRVTLSWTDSSGGKAKYRIYRGNTVIDEATGSSYIDYTVNGNTPYTYQVQAIDPNNSTSSGLSNIATLTTPGNSLNTVISGRCTAKIVS